MQRPQRELVPQVFYHYRLDLTAAGGRVALSKGFSQSDIESRIDTLLFCNDNSNTASAYFGGQNVTATVGASKSNGLEIRPGKSYVLNIQNERQLYELQGPLVDTTCLQPEVLPFCAWDISNCFLIANATLQISVFLFKAPYF